MSAESAAAAAARALRLADNLALPLDTVTQTVAILAKRRAGKSYTARRFVEQLHHAGQQVIVVDPKGDWWGVRSGADGKSPGLPIIILGGERGDVPLEVGAGEVVAKLVVEERVSALLDLSLLRKHEIATFMTAFLEALYRMKAREKFRTPVMLVIDEADAIAPQVPQRGEERMLGAAEDIVRRGGQRGIGCTLITQRTAVLNKNVLTQAQVLVALRTIAPQDLKAMNLWIDVHGTDEERKTLMASLPALPTGDAWFWSPGWPTPDGIFARIRVLPIETFDSGATPEPGEQRERREPRRMEEVDLEALRRQMSETMERAKQNDPAALRARIAELEARAELADPVVEERIVEVPTFSEADRAAFEAWKEQLAQVRDQVNALFLESVERMEDALRRGVFDARGSTTQAPPASNRRSAGTRPPREASPEVSTAEPRARRVAAARAPSLSRTDSSITGPQQRVLDAIRWYEAVGVARPSQPAVAAMARYSVHSSSFRNPRAALRAASLIEFDDHSMTLTPAGRVLANNPPPRAGAADLHHQVERMLSGPAWRLLGPLLRAYPKAMAQEALAAAAEYSLESSSYRNPRAKLRTLGLIEYSGDDLRAADWLFPLGRSRPR